MAYATVATGFRPGGGNAAYPTTGSAWGGAFQQQGYTSGKWPATYEPDRVVSYELGEKARMLDRRLTVNASVYYEDWRHIQLEAYPNDWALNINGNYAQIYGADIDVLADLGAGFRLELAAGYLEAGKAITRAGGKLDVLALGEWLHGGDVRDALGEPLAYASDGFGDACALLADRARRKATPLLTAYLPGSTLTLGAPRQDRAPATLHASRPALMRLFAGRPADTSDYRLTGAATAELVVF